MTGTVTPQDATHFSGAVTVDVATIMGAEDFIICSNRSTRSEDPFAQQCFAELVQSLLLFPSVLIPHPVLAEPRADDFGSRPPLLQALLFTGLVSPLSLPAPAWSTAQIQEREDLKRLQSREGRRSIEVFVDEALQCDSEGAGRARPLGKRVKDWSEFQCRVRFKQGHNDRITTSDGIEADEFGEWVRAAGRVFADDLKHLAPPGEEGLLLSAMSRGLRYLARANAASATYQCHPARRDFLNTFALRQHGVDEDWARGLTRVIRGIHSSIAEVAGPHVPRVRLMELELPLLGGGLWRSGEVGRDDDQTWMQIIVERILEYRDKCSVLRAMLASCLTEDHFLRLQRDVNEVRDQLMHDLGIRSRTQNALTTELVDVADSVSQDVAGIPFVKALWVLGRRTSQVPVRATSFQRFLYTEHLKAWRRAGK